MTESDFNLEANIVLKSASPTVNSDGNVTRWGLELELSYDVEPEPFVRNFTDIQIEVNSPEKPPEQYTKSELLGLAPLDLLKSVIKSSYLSLHCIPETEESVVKDFDLSSLDD